MGASLSINFGAQKTGEKALDKQKTDFMTELMRPESWRLEGDPFTLAQNMFDLAQQVQRISTQAPDTQPPGDLLGQFALLSPWPVYQTISQAYQKLLENPGNFMHATQTYMHDLTTLWQNAGIGALHKDPNTDTVIIEKPGDKRFSDEEWEKNPFFRLMKESYLLWDRWLQDITEGIQGLDPETRLRLNFYVRQVRDAFAPTNFFWSNPESLKATIETSGGNILQGVRNFLEDVESSKGQFNVKMTNREAFHLGDNLAATPGKIIYQNDLIQLIQYEPAVKEVFEVPVVIVPPCINKYYIFDLRPHNSFVKWLVDKGHTVFIISWVNPDEKLAHKRFEDYVLDGVVQALEVASKITKKPQVNAVGFCIGGNFLAAASGYLARVKRPLLASMTYLATLFDFKNAGELRVFINEDQLTELERQVKAKGYLDGRMLQRTFNLLRANDLIWSFVISNYYLGRTPSAFDFLYWNADSTNLPANMYTYFIRKMYLENRLVKPDGILVNDIPIDLSKIKTPAFVLNTREDHIAPWMCGYEGAKLFQGPVTFMLGGSGHIAGIFNPPSSNKYGYWTAPEIVEDPAQWFQNATETKGSWWETWETWLRTYAGKKVKSQTVGSKAFPVIEPAPGSYVKA